MEKKEMSDMTAILFVANVQKIGLQKLWES